jgi:succinate dehydrogenase/fumarate reductase flavoprotein subunit
MSSVDIYRSGAMTNDAPTVDLLVLGAGMAGCAAAVRAAREGASVVLVEKTEAIGGSAAYAGFVWSAPTVDVMQSVNPEADPALSSRLVTDYDDAIEWLRSLGVEVGKAVAVLGFGRGRAIDTANFLLTCERTLREADDCELLLGARTERLRLEDGRVEGALVVDGAGDVREIRARSTLLATGGFAGGPELRAELIHPQARDLPLRANRGSTGDGLRLGRSAGAAFGPQDAGFYGHLIPSHIAYTDPYEFATLTFYHSEHGVLLNLAGRRFWDETIGDHISPMRLLEQPEARALLVYDQHVHDEWMMRPYVEGIEPVDKFQLAYRRGARCAVAEELDEFGELPDEWAYPGPAVLRSLREFNRQCEAGRPEPGRANDARPLTEPPYYVIEVIPAITFSFGGLRIDAHARVLDEAGAPVPGLLAAGADTGGIFVRAYAGGLANALVFGLQAAATALASAHAAATPQRG